ncbi:hypothetical protein, partial [Paenibacillus cellulosilyticus]|uniref:hypothetical protein n=1 Tax=Paenibacillus cellulosilyticus TaxID=375489 RepID=UPI001C63F475
AVELKEKCASTQLLFLHTPTVSSTTVSPNSIVSSDILIVEILRMVEHSWEKPLNTRDGCGGAYYGQNRIFQGLTVAMKLSRFLSRGKWCVSSH